MRSPFGDNPEEFEYPESEHRREAKARVTAWRFIGMWRSDGVAGIVRRKGEPWKAVKCESGGGWVKHG